MPKYTVTPGRSIDKDGKPFICIVREGDTRPVDADTVTHLIALLLNGHDDAIARHDVVNCECDDRDECAREIVSDL